METELNPLCSSEPGTSGHDARLVEILRVQACFRGYLSRVKTRRWVERIGALAESYVQRREDRASALAWKSAERVMGSSRFTLWTRLRQ